MPWTIEARADAVRLAFSGHVDIFEANALYRVLADLADEPRRVQVDFTSCAAVDGSALQLLLAFRDARLAADRQVAFRGARDAVGRLILRFGLTEA